MELRYGSSSTAERISSILRFTRAIGPALGLRHSDPSGGVGLVSLLRWTKTKFQSWQGRVRLTWMSSYSSSTKNPWPRDLCQSRVLTGRFGHARLPAAVL